MSSVYNQIIEFIKSRNFKDILLIAFEDSEIVRTVNQNFQGNITILNKTHFVGAGFSTIYKLTHQNSFDLTIISNINSQVNRTKLSLKILATLSGSFHNVIIFDENEVLFSNKFKLIFELLPQLLIGLTLAFYVFVKAYLGFYIFYQLKKSDQKKVDNENKLILFLRTDLAGKIMAGGSVTHIKGFISGAKELNFETIYVADFPLINHPISIVVKPNRLLDFFDEIQMIDYHFRVIKKLRKCLKGINIGAIYQRHSIFNASGSILSSILNIPLILEVNNSEVWAKKNWSRLVLEKIAEKIEKFAFEKADIIGVVSQITKEQIVNLGANEKKIVINPNGVDPSRFSPTVDGQKVRTVLNLNNYFVIGFIGTFSRWHGVETLFDAAIKVLSINDKIKFLFIGDGNLKSSLELKTEQLGLKDKIIFTGIVPHEKAPEYLAACDVLVSPHLGFESGERFFGSPTKLFEYMAMGKPIIASDLEQIGNIIKDGINGLKFNPGDSNKLAELIIKLFEDEGLRTKIGMQARQDVIKNYTWKHNAYRVISKLFNLK